jgi:diguanylate cyclase (GGDEF)-like protein
VSGKWLTVPVGDSTAADLARRDWPLAREPRRVLAGFLLLCVAALGWGTGTLITLDATRRDWGVFGLLVGLALGYEEISRRVERPRLRLAAGVRADMTLVWSVAAAAALPGGLVTILIVVLFGHLWLRDHRPTDRYLHRTIGSGCVALVAALGANAVLDASDSAWADSGWLAADALSVLVVMAVYGAIGRGLVSGGRFLLGARGRRLFDTPDDIGNQLAALCLGGLIALSALHAPWLAVLALPPMVMLRRGAMVRELETAASVDAKTGLLNAVAWEELSRRELARGRRNHHPVGILILDVDRFKLINDRFGHLVGDEVLRQIGGALKASVREFDSVGRFGGEEFVVVLPEASSMESIVVAERLRARVGELRAAEIAGSTGSSDALLSVSVGVACAPDDGDDLTELLVAADVALYEAKARGRNCVVLADRGGREPVERVARR